MEEGNMAAMRDALEYASRVLAKWRQDAPFSAWNEYGEAIDKCRAALAKPPRQCDVGTADEQTNRYRKFCSGHKYLGSDFSHMCKGFGKGRCPFFNSRTKSQCEFAWAQMPYEKGGAK